MSDDGTAIVAWVVYQFGDGVQTHVLGSFATQGLAERAVGMRIGLLRWLDSWAATEWFDGAEWLRCDPSGPPVDIAMGYGWSDGMTHIRMVRTEVQGG